MDDGEAQLVSWVFILLPDYRRLQIQKIMPTFVDLLCKKQTAEETNSICYFC
jgi:hypothetical protein